MSLDVLILGRFSSRLNIPVFLFAFGFASGFVVAGPFCRPSSRSLWFAMLDKFDVLISGRFASH